MAHSDEEQSLKSDLIHRVHRLPEPRNTADALQPLFEAVMNSIQATQDKFGENVSQRGQVIVEVHHEKPKTSPFRAVVKDNGIGLDEKNYNAFLTTDTDHKIERGGKGVGRLLWLAGFEHIEISSDFRSAKEIRHREFEFRLSNEGQVKRYKSGVARRKETSCTVAFTGLRDEYRATFPQRPAYLFQHLLSHFLPILVGKRCPKIIVNCDDDARQFPNDIREYIHRRAVAGITYDSSPLTMEMLECDKAVSSDLPGSNFVHFIGHDRTVHSQPIDGKLGLRTFGEDSHVFHACVTGKFLDRHVNQERTRFTFEPSTIEDIVNSACMPEIEKFLEGPLKMVGEKQREALVHLTKDYPSVAFAPTEDLAKLVPAGETREEQLFSTLSVHRHRLDRKQREKISEALEKLKDKDFSPATFAASLEEASAAISATEQRSLAEYVVRRRVVLDFLKALLIVVKQRPVSSDYKSESTLHNFICPVRVKSGGLEASSHDLWIIDERLTFASAFSSDVRVTGAALRPDIIVFDHVYGLRQSANDARVLIVEFKRPGRTQYADGDNPQFQIENYIRELRRTGAIDINGRPIEIPTNARYHCFIVADRLGKLADWTTSWARTPDGRGRIYNLLGDYQGFIELIAWDHLIEDANERNRAFFERLGLAGERITTAKAAE